MRYFLSLLYALSVSMDFLSTMHCMSHEGFYEQNPLAAMILANYGFTGLGIAAAGCVALIVSIALAARSTKLIAFAVLCSNAVVIHNLWLLVTCT